MRDATIARNYADALLTLATKAEDRHGWGRMLRELADAVQTDARLRGFLESPRISWERKSELIGRAYQDRFPRLFVRWVQALLRKGRQMLLPGIADQYFALLDESEGRVHAQVTVARDLDEAGRASVAAQLSRALGKEVVPHLVVNPAILGGVIVRVGDTVMDGSVRRRLGKLRSALLATRA